MVAAGVVRLDGVAVRRPGLHLRAGQRLDAVLRLDELRPRLEESDRRFTLTAGAILYEDEWLLAVDKPAGLPTHATADPRRPSLVRHVEAWLRERGREPYVAVHQRLDRDTSGVVLFATKREANAGLALAFEQRAVEKTYVAIVECRRRIGGSVPFEIDLPLSADDSAPRVRVGGPGARSAVTVVAAVETLGKLARVEVQPRTGRKHQIRAHLAHVGLPILGDELYGGRRSASVITAARTMLHASRLVLAHPVGGRALRIESALPPDLLDALRRARAAID